MPRRPPLAQAMTPKFRQITPESRAIDALRRMGDGGFRHLPVVENERIWGIVSRGDFTGMETISRGGRLICGNAYADPRPGSKGPISSLISP